MTAFHPYGVHIGAQIEEGILLAYGQMNDELQAALVLVQPLPKYRRGCSAERDVPANYAVLLVDEAGRRYGAPIYFWNLHDASNYMQENLGQDR